MPETITQDQWSQYYRDGSLRLGRVADAAGLQALRRRIDDIMLGRAPVDFGRIWMQPDPRGEDCGVVNGGGYGHQGATLDDRKIQGLEHDPVFLACMRHPIFRGICGCVYGAHAVIACFRAMFINKPGRFSHLVTETAS